METTGSDNVGNNDAVNQNGTLTLWFIENRNGGLEGGNPINCKQPAESD